MLEGRLAVGAVLLQMAAAEAACGGAAGDVPVPATESAAAVLASATDSAAADTAAVPVSVPVVVFRPGLGDVATLRRVINDAYIVENAAASPSGFSKTVRFETDEPVAAAVASNLVLAARHGDAIVGVVMYRLHLPAVYFGPYAVAPGMQGRGVGHALMAALDDVARAAGATRIDINVVSCRFDELAPMYTKAGFVVTGERPYHTPSAVVRPIHLITMSRPLPPAPSPL